MISNRTTNCFLFCDVVLLGYLLFGSIEEFADSRERRSLGSSLMVRFPLFSSNVIWIICIWQQLALFPAEPWTRASFLQWLSVFTTLWPLGAAEDARSSRSALLRWESQPCLCVILQCFLFASVSPPVLGRGLLANVYSFPKGYWGLHIFIKS